MCRFGVKLETDVCGLFVSGLGRVYGFPSEEFSCAINY